MIFPVLLTIGSRERLFHDFWIKYALLCWQYVTTLHVRVEQQSVGDVEVRDKSNPWTNWGDNFKSNGGTARIIYRRLRRTLISLCLPLFHSLVVKALRALHANENLDVFFKRVFGANFINATFPSFVKIIPARFNGLISTDLRSVRNFFVSKEYIFAR